jgi:hypothetical protein
MSPPASSRRTSRTVALSSLKYGSTALVVLVLAVSRRGSGRPGTPGMPDVRRANLRRTCGAHRAQGGQQQKLSVQRPGWQRCCSQQPVHECPCRALPSCCPPSLRPACPHHCAALAAQELGGHVSRPAVGGLVVDRNYLVTCRWCQRQQRQQGRMRKGQLHQQCRASRRQCTLWHTTAAHTAPTATPLTHLTRCPPCLRGCP